jgi:hypothetical protein
VQLYAPRLPVFSSAFLLAALAVFAPAVDRAYHKLHTEGRVVSDVASVAYDVGRFTVGWDKTALRLAVTHSEPCDEAADCVSESWATVPRVAVLNRRARPPCASTR